jgi:hypothetical protein
MYELFKQYGIHREDGGTAAPRDTVTHAIHLPETEGYGGYHKILLVRNPYRRMLSLWKWQQDIRQIPESMQFTEFMAQRPSKSWMSVADMISHELLEEVTAIIHLETWNFDVESLPFVQGEVPFYRNKYRSSYAKRDKIAYYTPGLLNEVAEYYCSDFQIGGYDSDKEF